MPKKYIGIGLLVVGAILLYRGVTGFQLSFSEVVLGLIMLAVGYIVAGFKRPGGGVSDAKLPPGFKADYSYKNIALDVTTGQLWVREGGQTAVLQKSEVIGFEMKNTVYTGQTIVGPQHTATNNRLFIKTRHLSKPVWIVQFNSFGAGNRNAEALRVWYERLNAFYNYSA